ncbi:TRAP transporter fused permease subunit [Micromonospora sp. C32]|uniref:TRAP transporter permease n=1 Tax=unclassified Micromonospora TaxID=2617518 RepID=UPI001B382570|nr:MULTISPECIES: TRAP transporter fused permease subunit [unclassified Micromonospora]MBQ1045619.1 TRAP transporter fused permease subunit [Micromonospora sp. C72]MBQ1055728.1 TRAP transporter fused permease subunit [Micromonospora sp. C32]
MDAEVVSLPPDEGRVAGPEWSDDGPGETHHHSRAVPHHTEAETHDHTPAETQGAPDETRDAPDQAQQDARELAARFEEEKPGRVLAGGVGFLFTGVTVAVGLLTLWQVFFPLAQGSKYYLIFFLAGVLPMVFLAYPSGVRLRRTKADTADTADADDADTDDVHDRRGPTPVDWLLALAALLVCLYPVLPVAIGAGGGGYDAFLDRQGLLDPLDVAFGTGLLLLLLEACRRTTGWILPAVCVLFLGYGYYGGLLPQAWPVAHAGLDFGQLVDAFYNSDSGFYGTPLDVAASYIVLFTIYGAVLDLSGAGRFFVELSAAAFRRSRTAAGRTAVASGFLLGTVSGSGAATTVSIGAVTWPILRRAGYPAERAGGMLAAAGVGAILSPPTLGAAAFIIAEYLGVSYLQVLGWATVPTILYYLGILLSVEIDARRSGVRPVVIDTGSAWRLLARFGYHFLSLLVIIVVLALGASAMRAVVIATAIAALLSFLDRRHRLTPARLVAALRDGVRGVLAVSAVCAAAGIITATTTKTGLGPQAAALLIDGAQAVSSEPAVVLALTAVLAAVALSLLGLAVPVTASFVIGWVIIGPALLNLGVAAPAAAMFVFYFAVLSEVSPPTALAAVAAAAVTGGRLVPTMWQTLRYALPAYLIPLAFVITPTGLGLLGIGGVGRIATAGLVSALGVAVLAVAAGGWLPGVGPAGVPERILGAVAGLVLLWLEPLPMAIGAALAALAVAGVYVRRGAAGHAGRPAVEKSVDLGEEKEWDGSTRG